MNADDLSDTIAPRSDQLNADDLLTGPITVTVRGVTRGTPDQPVSIAIDGRQPYKPCKTMRRVLVACWGVKGSDWIGQSMTLYCDPSVKFGGVALGGIRISHVSGIDNPRSMMLTTTRSKRAMFTVHPLMKQKPQGLESVIYLIDSAPDISALKDAASGAKTLSDEDKAKAREHYEKRLVALRSVGD